jgi:hypothetical protein
MVVNLLFSVYEEPTEVPDGESGTSVPEKKRRGGGLPIFDRRLFPFLNEGRQESSSYPIWLFR